MKGEFFAEFKGLFFSKWRFNDKRVRYLGVEPEHLGIFRRRGFKDIRIDTLLLQQAIVALPVFRYTYYPFECITKTTAKGRAFIGRKAYLLSGADCESEFCQSKCFKHRN